MTWTVSYTGLLYYTFTLARFVLSFLSVNTYLRVPHEVEGLLGA